MSDVTLRYVTILVVTLAAIAAIVRILKACLDQDKPKDNVVDPAKRRRR